MPVTTNSQVTGTNVAIKNINQAGSSIGRGATPTATNRSEMGVGALMPWADRLYYLTYLADANVGAGGVLGYIDSNGVDTVVDYAVFNGRLAIATNNMSEHRGYWPTAGQPNSSIKFVDIDDIVKRKPVGKGYIWYQESVVSGTPSDPMLMRGYDKKALHLFNGSASSITVTINLIDYSAVMPYATTLTVAAGQVGVLTFPDGLQAEWFTITPSASLSPITAWVSYL